MPPSSGELWGHHLMPSQIDLDCLLPNGILVVLRCPRDATLEHIKVDLWQQAKHYPLFNLLSDPSSYIFVSVSQEAEKEEYYDETRRLCDLRLFMPLLKVVEPKGNREEKMLNFRIGIAIGIPINEFNIIKDLEVTTYRREILRVCQNAIEIRESDQHLKALNVYPPELEQSPDLPVHLQDKINEKGGKLIICIWVVSSNRERVKYTVAEDHKATPEQVIAEAIRRKVRSMDMTADQQKRCVAEYQETYVLKVCGCQQFLLAKRPISQYKYIRKCMSRDVIPQLMLMLKEALYSSLESNLYIPPSYMKKGVSALQKINAQETKSLWKVEAMFQVKINVATYVNVREVGKIYVKCGVYHGTEPLCPILDTRLVDSSTPRWSEWLEFALYMPDIPRCARLCISICCVSGKHRRKVHYALASGNLNLFDFNNRFQSGRVKLNLGPIPQGLDDLLNPVAIPGSNPNKDSPCIELEFPLYNLPVSFPSKEQIEEYAQFIEARVPDTLPTSPEELQEIDNDIDEISKRDPLSEMSEQEKELLWNARHRCKLKPDSLPKLLESVKWNSRECVAQVYLLLKDWPVISTEAALQLLYCTYNDLVVRKFAVDCLEKTLTEDSLLQYLLQLVQVMKFEPYLDNHLTRFLLRKALLSQNVGHFFFWHLKSEMNQSSIRLRFGLNLEAYARGCGSYLKNLLKQVEALEKLTKLTDSLKHEKEDEQLKSLIHNIKRRDFLDALENLSSPLNNSHILGGLLVERCKVMASKKRPLWLSWQNNDPMAEFLYEDFKIMFKNGDDLRQDMLTLQVIRIMDTIWESEGLDLRMTPYRCMSTGKNVGMIEVVRNAKTVMEIQRKQDFRAAMQVRSKELHRWIKEKNPGSDYEAAITAFRNSCAGYCVATFVLGIGDRHPDNIMVTENGQVFHIDFGHFLDHRKKKFGINRERVPFVLTEDFIRVIAKGGDEPQKSPEFSQFMQLCGKAYLCLRNHANTFITLFTMMLSCGIPELQSMDDIGYIRKTLAVEKTEQEALEYFNTQFNNAYGGAWTTKVDWFMHWLRVKHKGGGKSKLPQS